MPWITMLHTSYCLPTSVFSSSPSGLRKKKKNKFETWGSQAELPMIEVVGQVVPSIVKDHSAFISRVFG
jgi:hypothetical protein